MVTIKEIAEELGVSTTTVSNVIHGKTRKMSAETRKKIEEALVRYQMCIRDRYPSAHSTTQVSQVL